MRFSDRLTAYSLPETLTDDGLQVYMLEEAEPEKISHAALLAALHRFTGRTYAEEDVLRSPNQKPYLADGTVQFSVTHSRGIWMVCLAPASVPVGLDLQIHKEKYSPGVAKRYFHPTELALLDAAQTEGTDLPLFFDLWCARESYAKYTGDGVAGMDKDYSTLHSPVPLYKLDFRPGYSLFLCTALPGSQPSEYTDSE
ncbi:MAG: 4'-phosphopantetheinyl transferase superfamily protein [Clostridia bacterium]|nr:4'-phosphopantetheinyl transferase superfamily protein [Clostridia bacterium]